MCRYIFIVHIRLCVYIDIEKKRSGRDVKRSNSKIQEREREREREERDRNLESEFNRHIEI